MDRTKLFTLYTRPRKDGKAVYYARFRLPGGARSPGKNTGQTSEAAARRWAMEYLRAGHVVTRESITLESFADGFFTWGGSWAVDLRATGKRISERQCIEKSAVFTTRVIPEIGRLRLSAIDRAVVKDLRNSLFKKGYSGSSINKALSALRAVLEAAEERHLIQAVPKIERAGQAAQSRGILTIGEVRALFESPWPDPRAYAANLTAAVTGLRQGELLALQRMNLRGDGLTITRSWNQRMNCLNETTKTGRERFVPIPSKAAAALQAVCDLSPWAGEEAFVFFTTIERQPIQGRMLTAALKDALTQIGITEADRAARHVDFHSWRHWFNSVLVNARIPLQKVQALTGHATEKMTAAYYHLDELADVRAIQEGILR